LSLSDRTGGPIYEGISFIKWLLYSCLIGVIVGLVAVGFHLGIDFAAELRAEHPAIIWLLPLGGLSIVLMIFIIINMAVSAIFVWKRTGAQI